MREKFRNRILIVDDDTSDLIFLTHNLSKDYTIYTAKNGEDAIRKTRELLPDLILLDIVMPGMSGYDVLTVLKENKETKEIPVIFITGLGSVEDEEKGLAMGATDYISKPFSRDITKVRIDHQIKIINQIKFIENINYNLELTVLERTEELKRQTEAARAASNAKSVFLATMSHELKTPLNAIIGMAGIARNTLSYMESEFSSGTKRKLNETNALGVHYEKILKSIRQIIASSHHLLSIINDVLDMSKIDSGKLELSSKSFSSLQSYTEFAGMIEHNCSDKKIRFTTNTNEMKDIMLMGDRPRLNQVLASLLGNAIKFTPEGGEVNLSVHVLEENDDTITYRFSVSDTGIGMTEEQIGKLFKPFEQADSVVSAKFGGIGIGLTISQNIVMLMGGIINVESKIDEGSRFYFDLVFRKSGEIAEAKPEPQETYKSLTGKRILLADDIEINRMIIYEMLSGAGILLDEAENGRQAVDMFLESPQGYYDIILLDIQMPVMGGYEAAAKIRSLDRPDSKTVPIIALTANSFKEDVNNALASGMNDHLPKPIDVKMVMDTLEKYINPGNKTDEEEYNITENAEDLLLSADESEPGRRFLRKSPAASKSKYQSV